MAGMPQNDVIENFDLQELPARMRSRVILMSASDVRTCTSNYKARDFEDDFRSVPYGMISNDSILSPASVKKNRRSTGLP